MSLFEPIEFESLEKKDKIAVIKLGSRIAVSSSGTSGGTGEALSIIKILLGAGYSVDAYTKVLKNDDIPTNFNIFDIEQSYKEMLTKEYKALFVLNGNVNYFGGQDDPAQTLNYYIINHFKGKIFYIFCDCNLWLKQIWPSIENKSWANKYNKNDIEITRSDIVYISQPRNTGDVLDTARKYINISNVIHFPFEKFPLMTSSPLDFNNNPKYDLLYGGTFRGGHREDDMIKFYFGINNNYNVSMFGKINASNFNQNKINGLSIPNFEKAVPYDLFNSKMNESKATVIIGDPIYKKLDDLAQRIYESINAANVILLDASYDYNKIVFNNKELRDFCYVSNRDDVNDKLQKLQDTKFRKYLVDLQRLDTKLDVNEYCLTLYNIIRGELC